MTLDHTGRWYEEYSDHIYDVVKDLARHLIGFDKILLYNIVGSGHASVKGHIVISLVSLHILTHTLMMSVCPLNRQKHYSWSRSY